MGGDHGEIVVIANNKHLPQHLNCAGLFHSNIGKEVASDCLATSYSLPGYSSRRKISSIPRV